MEFFFTKKYLGAGTTLGDHDLIRSIDTEVLQESVMGIVTAGKVGLGLGLVKEVAESQESGSGSQKTLHTQGGREGPDIGRPDVEDIVFFSDLKISWKTARKKMY